MCSTGRSHVAMVTGSSTRCRTQRGLPAATASQQRHQTTPQDDYYYRLKHVSTTSSRSVKHQQLERSGRTLLESGGSERQRGGDRRRWDDAGVRVHERNVRQRQVRCNRRSTV